VQTAFYREGKNAERFRDSAWGYCVFSSRVLSHLPAIRTEELSVALDVTISFIRSATAGRQLTVEVKEIHTGNKTSFYDIKVTGDNNEVVAIFKGTAYRTQKPVYANDTETD
jgi:acyl-coenzyme A thioesterase PaaI-like protein